MKRLLLAAVAVLGSATAFAIQPIYLNIGDPAPTLSAAKWIKGAPVPKFNKGQVYLVEFWSTWCHPCRDNIPHLTELAHKYGDKVQVVGVSIWENASNQDSRPVIEKRVSDFVASQGDQMDYHVGLDSAKGTIGDAYMKAAGEGGIPCSYIVGRDGKVAWIGHPATIEGVLTQVLDGKFDVKAAREKREIEQEVTRPIDIAMQSKNYPALVMAIDAAVNKRPKLEYRLTYPLLVGLYHADLPRGKALSRKILKDSNGAIGAYQMMASIFATTPDLSKEAYTFGLTIIDEGKARNEGPYMFWAMKGEVYYALHDYAKAVECGERGVALGLKEPNMTPQTKALLLRTLEKFRSAGK